MGIETTSVTQKRRPAPSRFWKLFLSQRRALSAGAASVVCCVLLAVSPFSLAAQDTGAAVSMGFAPASAPEEQASPPAPPQATQARQESVSPADALQPPVRVQGGTVTAEAESAEAARAESEPVESERAETETASTTVAAAQVPAQSTAQPVAAVEQRLPPLPEDTPVEQRLPALPEDAAPNTPPTPSPAPDDAGTGDAPAQTAAPARTPSPARPEGAKPEGGKAAQESRRLFGTIEMRASTKELRQWQEVQKRHADNPIFTSGFKLNASTTWDKLKSILQGKSPLEQIRGVNSFWNQWPYKLDKAVYGKEDYWAAPYEFRKNSGDCEDYAIAKYYTLKELGFSVEQLRIVVLKDTILNVAHAILAVYLDDDIYILDNVAKNVLSHTRIRNYLPVYSLNEKYRWVHMRTK